MQTLTDDQQFILALATIVLPLAASILTYRKTVETHDAVNGMQVKKVGQVRRRARAAGVASERKRENERSIEKAPSSEP